MPNLPCREFHGAQWKDTGKCRSILHRNNFYASCYPLYDSSCKPADQEDFEFFRSLEQILNILAENNEKQPQSTRRLQSRCPIVSCYALGRRIKDK